MSRLLKFFGTLRRHWKKSTVAFTALGYGISYGYEKYTTFQLMRAYCEEAKKYGEQLLPQLRQPRHVTVILNPAAHNKKAKSRFEKYAAPLLYLAGLKVSIFQTENEGQAISLMEIMSDTDAVIVAGGDGTLHEAVTGLLRRPEYEDNITVGLPIGVLPVGSTNTVAKYLFHSKAKSDAQWLAEAAMAIIRETTVLVDVMKIEGIEEKPVFALAGFELGTYTDLEASLSKYWYFGPLKTKMAYLINSIKNWPVIKDINLNYVYPCEGCSQCYSAQPKAKNNETKRWWSVFVPRVNTFEPKTLTKDYSSIINEECGVWHSREESALNILISTSVRNFSLQPKEKSLNICLHPTTLTKKQFITNGFNYHDRKPLMDSKLVHSLYAQKAKLSLQEMEDRSCYIDSEKYPVQSVNISLLPKYVLLYG